jgi:hypothetical protein
LTALERVREAAFPTGEHVGRESFMLAAEVRTLAHQAGVGRVRKCAMVSEKQ